MPLSESIKLMKKFDEKLQRISLACNKSAKHSALLVMAMAELYMCTTDVQQKA